MGLVTWWSCRGWLHVVYCFLRSCLVSPVLLLLLLLLLLLRQSLSLLSRASLSSYYLSFLAHTLSRFPGSRCPGPPRLLRAAAATTSTTGWCLWGEGEASYQASRPRKKKGRQRQPRTRRTNCACAGRGRSGVRRRGKGSRSALLRSSLF